jgi:hypothetical protein
MKPFVRKAILGGLAGTAVLTMMMYLVAPMMLGRAMDIAAILGSMMGNSWALGMAAHWMNGVLIFPLLYAFLMYKVLPSPPVARGAMWGVVLWLIAQSMLMPMMGAGFFSSATGGMMAAVASLIGHILYGGILGKIAGSAETA